MDFLKPITEPIVNAAAGLQTRVLSAVSPQFGQAAQQIHTQYHDVETDIAGAGLLAAGIAGGAVVAAPALAGLGGTGGIASLGGIGAVASKIIPAIATHVEAVGDAIGLGDDGDDDEDNRGNDDQSDF